MTPVSEQNRLQRNAYTVRDLVILAFYSWKVLLAAFLAVFFIGLVAAVTSETQYNAEGRMLVRVSREHAGDQSVASSGPAVVSIDGLKAVESEINILVSPAVVRRMVEKIGPDTLFPYLGNRRFFGLLPAYPASDRIGRATIEAISRLKADAASDSNIVRVTFHHRDPELAARAVNVLLESYLAQRQSLYEQTKLPLLTAQIQREDEQIDRLQGEIQKVLAEENVVDVEQEVLLAANQTDAIVARHRQISERGESLKAEIQETQAKLAATKQEVFDFHETSDQVQNDEKPNLLIKLKLQRDQMLEHFSPDYPPLVDVERQIKEITDEMLHGQKTVFNIHRNVRNPTQDFLTNHLMQLQIEYTGISRMLVELDKQKAEAEARTARLRSVDMRVHDLRRTLATLEQLQHDFTLRAEVARVEEKAALNEDASVRVSQWAAVPVMGSSMWFSLLLAGVFGGAIFAAAVGVAGAWLRQVFILPGDAVRYLNMPALAVMSEKDGSSGRRRARDEAAMAASRLAETTIDDHPLESLMVVSDSGGQPMSEAVVALASELAQSHDKSVLLIDLNKEDEASLDLTALGDSRRLPLPKNLKLEEMSLATTHIPGLVVTRGAAHSLLGNYRTPQPQIKAMLDHLKQHYDIVMVAAPPMKDGPLAQKMASMVDVNVMVLEAERTRAPVALRLRDMLLESGGDILGFMLTGRRFHIPKAIYRWI